MVHLPSFRTTVTPQAYLLCAPVLILAQHLLVASFHWMAGAPLEADLMFWLFPLHRLFDLPGLAPWTIALAFAVVLLLAWAIALLSFRRANWSGAGHSLAALSFVPTIQLAAVAFLTILPPRSGEEERADGDAGREAVHVLEGALAGTTIIVAAVVVSAVTFGAYGWGLFVATPFMAGLVTGYLANRKAPISGGETAMLVLGSGMLGTLALLMLALEGLMCILLIAPLAGIIALVGGFLGRLFAVSWHRRGPLASIAILPLLFALEGALPPSVPIVAEQKIDIAAPPAAVWQALVSGEPIGLPPNLVGQVGLAYPVRGRLAGEGVGAERIGEFSTGFARERVTDWAPGRRLAFTVLTQPPSMEEMSPYRRVHAPHVSGYFDTEWTSFDLAELPGGGTRLTARAAHVLRIEPALYWEPIARWAIRRNVGRVLEDVRLKAERAVDPEVR